MKVGVNIFLSSSLFCALLKNEAKAKYVFNPQLLKNNDHRLDHHRLL